MKEALALVSLNSFCLLTDLTCYNVARMIMQCDKEMFHPSGSNESGNNKAAGLYQGIRKFFIIFSGY